MAIVVLPDKILNEVSLSLGVNKAYLFQAVAQSCGDTDVVADFSIDIGL